MMDERELPGKILYSVVDYSVTDSFHVIPTLPPASAQIRYGGPRKSLARTHARTLPEAHLRRTSPVHQ